MADRFTALACQIPGITAVVAESARQFARHSHDQFGLGVIDAGAQRSLSGRGPVEAQEGDLITVNPGEVHDGLPIAGAARGWRMLYLDPALLRSGSAEAEFCWPALRDPGAARRFDRLFAALTGPVAAPLQAEADLHLLLVRLQDRPRRAPPPARIGAALQRLADAPADPVSLAELADMTGLSRFHFLRSFAAATGLTPHAFQIQHRLQLARRLIAARTPLAEAAVAAGFSDQSHLTRLFRRSYGLTPKAYARAQPGAA